MSQITDFLSPTAENLIAQYGTPLLRFCYLYLLDLEQAQKVVQAVFVRAYAYFSAHEFDEKKLLRITVRLCRKHASPYAQGTAAAEAPILFAFQHMTTLEREIILLHYYTELALEDVASISCLPVFVIKHCLSSGEHLLERCSPDALTD